MTDSIELMRVDPEHQGRDRSTGMDLVFVHGLGGHWHTTWRSDDHGWWPQWVADHHPTAQVWCLAYPAKAGHLATLGASTQLGSAALATAALAHLRDHKVGQRPCILVCHSLGGLLAKRMLLEARSSVEVDRFQHDNVAAVVFLGTPHRGAGVADFLKRLESVKNLAPAVIAQIIGAVFTLPASQVLTTTELINELKQGAMGLQVLNEKFVQYYSERHHQNPLRVRVFAETERLHVGFVPTVMVVDAESANPNLRAHVGDQEVQPIFVPGADHSTLVKLKSRDGQVWHGLNQLIEEVGIDRGSFAFDDPARTEVARAIYAKFKEQALLLNLPSLASMAYGTSDAECAHNLAQTLAAAEGEAVNRAISVLRNAAKELADKQGTRPADVAALETAVGWLVTLALSAQQAATLTEPKQGAAAEFWVPLVGDVGDDEARSFLSLMLEVLHAALRRWPTRWQLAGEDSTVKSGAWVMQSEAAAHPSSWHNEDHLRHLQERIVASAQKGDRSKPQVLLHGQAEATPGGVPARAAQALQIRSTKHLKLRFSDKDSLVIAATQPGSPYQNESLRAELARHFGALVALALPEPSPTDTDALLLWAIDLQVELQQFMIEAQRAHNRVQPHA